MISRGARSWARLPLLVSLLCSLVAMLPAAIAHAGNTVSWQALVPSVSVWPAYAGAHGGEASNAVATGLDELHSTPLAQAGRQDGFAETAHWRLHVGKHAVSASLLYSASLFSGSGAATAAAGDALATLWEAGMVVPLAGTQVPVFALDRPKGAREWRAVVQRGLAEIDITLRLGAPVPPRQQSAAWRPFVRLVRAAQTVSMALPAPAPPSTLSPAAPLTIAPPGTGPTTKSPALMVLGDAALGPALGPGSTRPSSPPLLAGAQNHPILTTPDAVERYVRTAGPTTASSLYNSAALYPNAAAAASAMQRLAAADRVQLAAQVPDLTDWPYLQSAADVRLWTGPAETVLAVRFGNVLQVIAGAGLTTTRALTLAETVAGSVPSWLHAQGTQIVNAAGQPVKINALNWYGAEEADFVPGGLDYRPYTDILTAIAQLGYNAIRLPFSNQLVEQNPVVSAHLAANPTLQGLHALDILDRIVATAGALGLMVILDDHRSEAGWSAEGNGLWYTAQYPESAWLQDWSTMAMRYAGTNTVVGMDLRNEPHATASWGDGVAATDWRLAAQRGGDIVLAADPRALIFVEGVQNTAVSGSYWWGGNLSGVAAAPVVLTLAGGKPARSQLVYSPHDYGKDNCGTGCPWFSVATSSAALDAVWDRNWGYIAENPGAPYAAPIWVGEFGTCNTGPTCLSDSTPGSQGQWFDALIHYLGQHDFGWAYWSANGTQSTAPGRTYGQVDWYGLFDGHWQQPVPLLNDDLQGLMRLQRGATSVPTGP